MKKVICFICCCAILMSCLVFSASAANTVIAFSANEVKPGDSVTVTVKLNADAAVYGYDMTLEFDNTILQYVSGADSANGGTLKKVDSPSGDTTISWNVQFKALKEGNCTITASTKYSGADLVEVSGGDAGATLKVAQPAVSSQAPTSSQTKKPSTPAVSSNANLSSLSLSAGTLSPEFSSSVTEYNVLVENSVANITLNAVASNKGSTIAGAGEIALEVGDNKIAITVTASDKKTKKVYNLTIRRATIEESTVLNPTAVIINGKLCHIKADLSEVPVPAGFALATATYNGAEVNVFKSENDEYNLFVITDDETGTDEYYIYKDLRDEFVPLNYLIVNNNIVILCDLPEVYYLPEGYYETGISFGHNEVVAFCSADERVSDIYILYCYTNGNKCFYRFDMKETTLQRAPDFELLSEPPVEISGNLIERFNALDNMTKTMAYIIAGEALAIVVLLILVIVAFKKRAGKYDVYEEDLLLNDENMNEYYNMINSASSKEDEITTEE